MTGLDHAALRIIDANLNRAREALRVMEEHARFGLDDAGLSAAIKEVRHALAKAVVGLEGSSGVQCGCESARAPDNVGTGSARGSLEANTGQGETRGSHEAGDAERSDLRGSLIAHRDIVGDVGRDVAAPSEYARSDTSAVATAAAKRLSEALRAIEEYGKTIDRTFAATVEQLRYQGYELERRLALVARARDRFNRIKLYVLITEALCAGDWLATAKATLDGGADCIQLREKQLSDRELLDRARRLAALCRERDALFILNDRPDLAVMSNASGVHLGQGDVAVADARRVLPSAMLIGVSTHTREQLTAAAAQAPDYIAVGPMFASTTKPQDFVAGPAALATARAHTSLPLVAIGGIDADNAQEVLAAADCCLCVCSAVISQPDVTSAMSRLRAIVDQATTGQSSSG